MLYVVDVIFPYAACSVIVAAFFFGIQAAPNDLTLRLFLTWHSGVIELVIGATLITCFLLGQHLVRRLERQADADGTTDYSTRHFLAKQFLSIAGNPYFNLNYVVLVSLLWLSLGPVGLVKEGDLGCAKVAFIYELARIITVYGGYCIYVDYSNKLPTDYSSADWSAEKRIYPLHFDDVSSEYRRFGWVLVGACGGIAVFFLEIIKLC